MKRLSLLLAVLSLGLSTHAFALTGGPWDNGDYSILNERGGVYQAAFSFSNGSGVAVFAQDNSFEVASATSVTGMFSLRNRSMFYYKGVTYAGVAWGIVDVDARFIQGYTNGNSDYAASGGQAATVSPTQDGLASARDNEIVHNGALGATANSQFTAKIYQTYPILRFSGTGRVTFMGYPELNDMRVLVTTLGATAAPTLGISGNTSQFQPTVVTFADGTTVAVATTGPTGAPLTTTPVQNRSVTINPGAVTNTAISNAGDYDVYISQLQQLLDATSDQSAQINNPSTYEQFQESHNMTVYGSRRYY